MAARALIVEDEPLARRTLRDFLVAAPWVELVGEAEDGPSALRLISELRPDLVFLDVRVPGLSGVQVLERLDYEPTVVFTTAHDEYAVSAFELGAVDYLLKPFGRERFERTLARVRRRMEAGSAAAQPLTERVRAAAGAERLSRLFVRTGDRIVPVPVATISRLEAEDDYVLVHAESGRHLVTLTLNEFERRLDPQRFRRVHRSHLVNLDYVASIASYDRRLLIRMRDGSEVLASRDGSHALRELVF